MKVRTLLSAAAVLLLAFPLAACGNNDDSIAAKNISAAVRKGNDNTFKMSKKQADCFGKEIVDKVGVSHLKKYKLLNARLKANAKIANIKMSKTDANGTADALTDCIDAKKFVMDSIGSQLPANAKDCVSKALTTSIIHDLFAAEFAGGSTSSAAEQKLTQPLMKCMTGQ